MYITQGMRTSLLLSLLARVSLTSQRGLYNLLEDFLDYTSYLAYTKHAFYYIFPQIQCY